MGISLGIKPGWRWCKKKYKLEYKVKPNIVAVHSKEYKRRKLTKRQFPLKSMRREGWMRLTGLPVQQMTSMVLAQPSLLGEQHIK